MQSTSLVSYVRNQPHTFITCKLAPSVSINYLFSHKMRFLKTSIFLLNWPFRLKWGIKPCDEKSERKKQDMVSLSVSIACRFHRNIRKNAKAGARGNCQVVFPARLSSNLFFAEDICLQNTNHAGVAFRANVLDWLMDPRLSRNRTISQFRKLTCNVAVYYICPGLI